MPPDPSRAGWFLLVLFILLLPCLGVVCWNEIVDNRDDTVIGTIAAIGRSMGQFVILMTVVALFAVEGIPMLAEQFLKRRREEGRAQGRKEGREERDREWHEFLEALKSELEKKGIEVELPPPPSPP